MPTLLFGILLLHTPTVVGLDVFSFSLRASLLVLLFIGTFAAPSLIIYYLFRTGYVRNLYLDQLADRRLPYFLTALIYTFVGYLFAYRMQIVSTLSPEIPILLGSITVSILLVGLISLYWQISAHGVGIGGVLGSIAALALKFSLPELFLPTILLVILTSLVASARLKLNAHTPAEVGAGLLLGLTVSVAAVAWLV
ncbi:hypothetical protein HU175_19645 [Spirosoma sp. KUDC1026]|nr:hypothetical protein HU175_19645 [Spirosoma sp. KUDC1026]